MAGILKFLCFVTTVAFATAKYKCIKDVSSIIENYDCQRYSRQCEPPLYKVTCSNLQENELDLLFEEYSSINADYVMYIIIEHSSISVLHTTNYKNHIVKSFRLSDLNISKILPGFFVGIHKLQELYLDGNNLTEIIDGTFSSLTQLKLLNLSGNNIQKLTQHIFSGMTNLKTLDVSKNNMSDINQNMFEYNPNLQSLNLSENALESFDLNRTFQPRFTHINLGGNKLKLFHFDAFPFLTYLNLSHNTIASIANLSIELKTLDLSYNSISNITNTFFNTSKLEYLDLNNNNISDLPIGCFRSLTNLTYLDVSRNKITKIQHGTLEILQRLKRLNIEGNLITEINFYAVPLGSLEEFRFGDNLINSFDVNALIKYSPNLRVVSLQSASWQCGDLAEIAHVLQSKNIDVPKGGNFNGSNFKGIKCREGKSIENNDRIETNSNRDVYFEKDFYKYLETLKKGNSFDAFDKNFENSNVYKYLRKLALQSTTNQTAAFERLVKATTNQTAAFERLIDVSTNQTKQMFEKFVELFRKNKDTKEIAERPVYNANQLNEILANNSFVNYINWDYRNASQMTANNTNEHPENFGDFEEKTMPEKLIRNDEESNSGVTYVNLLSNLLQVATLLFAVYVFSFWKNNVNNQRLTEQNIQLV